MWDRDADGHTVGVRCVAYLDWEQAPVLDGVLPCFNFARYTTRSLTQEV
ncbi:MAG TPA: hypothetical protein VF821_05210 [Lentzea sp.]